MEPFNWHIKEPDLHSWIIDAYTNLGYDCINFHESGACVENGLDILTNSEKNSIGIAVKIKPQKKDIPQLKKLLKSKVNKKIYIYIKDPTKEFFDYLNSQKQKEKLSVMNSKMLHEFLINNKSTNYVKRYIFSHQIFRNIITIMNDWYSVRETENTKPTKNDIDLMWNWKDKVVSFHKTAKAIYECIEPKIKDIDSETQMSYSSTIDLIISFLNYLDYETEQLKSITKKIKQKNPGWLSYMWIICIPRTTWNSLLAALENKENQSIEGVFYEWFFNNLLRDTSLPYTSLIDTLENMSEFGHLMEMAVDWVFAYRKL